MRRSARIMLDDGKFRKKVLQLVREKYGGPVGERFGPTLGGEHLASEDGLNIQRRDAATVDADRGVVEPRAEGVATPSKAGAQGALWGVGADGR